MRALLRKKCGNHVDLMEVMKTSGFNDFATDCLKKVK